MMEMKQNSYFAEVIESSLTGWLAQSWQWDHFPSFGSLVSIKEKKRTLFGVVHQVQTGSMDPMRYPFPYQKTEEELLQEQPQIFEFLKTTFSCIVVGYEEHHSMTYLIAPEPPKIHSFISSPDLEMSKRFFSGNRYLHVLFSNSGTIFNIDELMLALLKHHAELHILSSQKLSLFMQTYALLIGNDYRRIKLFLQRVEGVINIIQQ